MFSTETASLTRAQMLRAVAPSSGDCNRKTCEPFLRTAAARKRRAAKKKREVNRDQVPNPRATLPQYAWHSSQLQSASSKGLDRHRLLREAAQAEIQQTMYFGRWVCSGEVRKLSASLRENYKRITNPGIEDRKLRIETLKALSRSSILSSQSSVLQQIPVRC
jgi:hypothetical protein